MIFKIRQLIKKILLFLGSPYKIKDLIILESHADYSDNSRSFYEYLINNNYNEKYKIYWFVNDAKKFEDKKAKNVKFLTMWTVGTKRTLFQWIKYFWIVKNAKFLIFSNRNLPKVNRKTKKVYINHGVAIKSVKGRRMVPLDADYVVDASEFGAELLMDQQDLKRDQIIVVGNPRNDIIFTKTDIAKKVKDFKKYKKVVLWLPTFRVSKTENRVDSTFEFPLGLPIIYDVDTLKSLNDYLNERNIALVIKPHPAQDMSVFKAEDLSNIIIINDQYLIDHNTELTEFYKITDALITDYSSVYVDYLLTQKPICFTQDDFEEYKLGFSMPNIQDYMPGEKVKNIEEFKQFFDHLDKGIDKYKKERKKVNDAFNAFNDNKSSERLIKAIDL